MSFVSRAGAKLEHAISTFKIDVAGKICADLGCSTGGFTDCLLQHQAKKVYAVDTGYGVLEWKLRKNPRVEVMERTNAMHFTLPEPMDIVTIDVAWTKQKNILPNAKKLLSKGGSIISLIKPHYEAAPAMLRRGALLEAMLEQVLAGVKKDVEKCGLEWVAETVSPIRGTGGNVEYLALLQS